MVLFEKHGMDGREFFHSFPLRNYDFPGHFHRAFELIFVNDGEMYVSVDQQEYCLQKNDMAFVFPSQMHEFRNSGHSEITICLFSPELIGDFSMNYKGMVPTDNILHLESAPDFRGLTTVYAQKSFLYGLCADLVRKPFTPVQQSPQTKVLYKMLLYVEQHYSSDCTLKEAARHLQYDYPYLSKLFVKQMSMTFTDYLNRYRISQACYLLKNSHQSIGDIAILCGYNNLKTFHRNFREITAHSPREYRALE